MGVPQHFPGANNHAVRQRSVLLFWCWPFRGQQVGMVLGGKVPFVRQELAGSPLVSSQSMPNKRRLRFADCCARPADSLKFTADRDVCQSRQQARHEMCAGIFALGSGNEFCGSRAGQAPAPATLTKQRFPAVPCGHHGAHNRRGNHVPDAIYPQYKYRLVHRFDGVVAGSEVGAVGNLKQLIGQGGITKNDLREPLAIGGLVGQGPHEHGQAHGLAGQFLHFVAGEPLIKLLQHVLVGRKINTQGCRLGIQQPAEQMFLKLLGKLRAGVRGVGSRLLRGWIEQPRFRSGWCRLFAWE